MALVVSMMLAICRLPAHAQGKERPMKQPTLYRTTQAALSVLRVEDSTCGKFMEDMNQ